MLCVMGAGKEANVTHQGHCWPMDNIRPNRPWMVARPFELMRACERDFPVVANTIKFGTCFVSTLLLSEVLPAA